MARLLGIDLLDDVLDEAVGHGHRRDPVAPRTGGPAGNARLTSWTGVLLLVVIVAELVTLLDVTGLIRWHVGLGVVLVALALLKTGSTGWRILRYYVGSPSYRAAGPPPTLLRLLGPAVIVATLGVLGSGLALIALGASRARRPWFTLLGQPVDMVTLHKGFFLLFAAAAGLHVGARLLPALALTTGRPVVASGSLPRRAVPGGVLRLAMIASTILAGVVATALVVPGVHGWPREHELRRGQGVVRDDR